MASLTADQAFAQLKEYVERGGNAGKKSMNDMLPVTESRNAKWWYSTFHNVSAIVGVGVLGFPAAMAHLTWGPGIAVLVLSLIITLYTFWQLVEMHEMIPGKRFDRYHELGQEAFGERLGLWIVVPLQLGVQVSKDIVYMVSGGLSLQNVYRLAYGKSSRPPFGIASFILVFASPQFILAQLRNFNSITGVSLAAAVMSLSYTTIAWGSSIKHGCSEANYDIQGSVETRAFGALNAIGVVAFAYSGHSVALEIQASIPSTATKPSKDAMWKGVCLAYAVVALCYLGVGISGYWAFGYEAQSKDNILTLVEHPRRLMIAANLMVTIHLLGSYQVYAMPVYDMLELVQVLQLARLVSLEQVSAVALRTTIRCCAAFTAFVACLLPFFNALLAFFGGFVLAPTTYFMPCVIWLILKRPKRFSLSWIINWVLIILGVLLMLGSAVGGMWRLVNDFKKFSFFHLKSDPAEAPAPHPPVVR